MDEIDLVLAQFEQDPGNQEVQQKILDLVKSQTDASALILRIVANTTFKPDTPGTNIAGFVEIKFAPPASNAEPPRDHVSTKNPIGPMGELHSKHLYFAAKCIGRSSVVKEYIVDKVIERLLIEFDLEVVYPQAAIIAFGEMGDKAVPTLIQYLNNRQRETFSREDAALALGKIGTDLAVNELAICLENADDDDKAMSLYALGQTNNPNARLPIFKFMNTHPGHERYSFAEIMLGQLPPSEVI